MARPLKKDWAIFRWIRTCIRTGKYNACSEGTGVRASVFI